MESVPTTTDVECHPGEVQLIKHYVIKIVSDLRLVDDFLCTLVSSTNKTDRHDITEILLKVAFNIITLHPLTLKEFTCGYLTDTG